MKLRIAAATVSLAWSWQTASGQSVTWNKRPGLAIDISGNAEGGLWALGVERENQFGFQVFRLDGADWVRDYNTRPGRRLAVARFNHVYSMDDFNAIYWQYGASQLLWDRKGRDIAVGGAGSVWIIGTDKRPGGYGIYQRTGFTWTDANGGAVRIAVEKDGTPWVVNEYGEIFRFNAAAQKWDLKPGRARSVHAGAASGAVWVLGVDPIPGGYPIYQWNPATQNWAAYGSYGAVVITEAAGTPWIAQSDGSIYSRTPPLTISVTDITITPTTPAMTPQAQPPVRVQAAGKLLCTVADSGSASYCGETNADFVGGYTLNTDCKEGFYDLIHGGTCWKCPDETDGRGAWIRSADPVDRDTACWRVPKETTAHAIKVRSPAWAWDCPSGSFWDGYSPDGIGGSCWRCPDDNPRRTAAAVWASNACASTLNERRPATFLTFNGCPTPNAATMNLAGKRTPGKPFLDIAAGAGDGYAAGCFACPIADEAGNFLITSRNANALYDRDNNNGCRVLMKWQPPPFSEPGLAYLQGTKEVIWEQKLFEGNRITGFLYDLARSQDLGDATPEARAWVAARWQEIARNPYNSASLRSYAFVLLKAALNKGSAERTPGEQKLIQSFASYIQQRRTYLAEQGLAMYDAWKANDEAIRAEIRQDASLGALFYYGTVPLDFHGTVGSLMGLGSVGGGVAGALIAANQFIQGIETTTRVIEGVVKVVPTYETSLPHLLSTGLDILRTGQGVAVISGATVITVAGLILTSIALDQSIAIESARPTLEASLTEARKPVNLNMLAKATNGEDMLYYYWAKAMDTSDREDPQVVQLAAQAQAWAQQNGYQAPPKQFVEVTVGPTSVGDAISSATGAASPFTSPGLTQNQKLVSANGIYHALMQGDGNFVIYIYAEDRAIWSTGTHGKGRAPYRLAMQPDGNLVVYGSSDQDVTLSGYGVCRANSACIATWASGPRGGTAPYTLRMQDDGNLVMYDSTQRPVWASGTQR